MTTVQQPHAREREVPLIMRATEALLLAAYDEEAVLAAAVSLLGDHFGYGARYVLLYDRQRDELAVAHAAGTGADRPEVKAFRTKLGQGLTGIAAQTRAIVNVGDVRRDPRYLSVIAECRSEICVPLVVRDELLGVIAIESPQERAFGTRDEELLTAFSHVAALALIHARADQRRRKDIAELQAVNDVATAAASLDLDSSLRAAVEGFQKVTTSDSTAIYLWNEAEGKLTLGTLTFDPQYYPSDYESRVRERPLALGEGMVGWAAEQRRAAMIDDVAKDPRPQPVTGVPLESKSAIVIPLVVEDRLFGVIRAVKMGVGSYSVDQYRFAQTLANQVALLLAAAKAHREQSRRIVELSALHEVSRRLSDASRLSEVLSYVLDGAIGLAGAEAGLIWRLDDEDRFFLAASHNLPAEKIREHPPEHADSVSRRILATGRPLRIPDVQPLKKAAWPRLVPHLHGMLALPLRSEGRSYGTLLLLHSAVDHFRPEHERLLEVLAAQGAAAIARADALEEAQRLAITDPLTGLYNTRYFSARLAAEIQRAQRYGHELALLIVDSDALKLVNDRLGHAAGNELLVSLARTIRLQVRASDLVARFGGDEFVILQPETGVDPARATAERIRASAYAASDAAGVERSVSVGVATFPAAAADPEALFSAADDALYRAKREGKDRVRVAGEP
jgi:diguanylate cyclase (GGDEF)-like protein